MRTCRRVICTVVCFAAAIGSGLVCATDGPASVDLAFPNHDLSAYLQTERLENVYTVLCGDGVCALVDLHKNRVLRLFAYGRFGTLQNLAYHVQNDQSYWFEGLHVYHARDAEEAEMLYPFRANAHADDHSTEGRFDAGKAEEVRRGTALYARGMDAAAGFCDWSARLEGTKLILEANVDVDQGDTGRTGVEGTLYPLYDEVLLDGTRQPIVYEPRGSALGGPWVESECVEFCDSQGQMPRLRLSCEGGRVRHEAVTLTNGMPGARSLICRAARPGKAAKVTLEVLPNPVAIAVCPLMLEGSEVPVRVLATGAAPTLELNDKAIGLSKVGDGVWEGKIAPAAGRQSLTARANDAVSRRVICAVSDFRKATLAMADALLCLQHKTEEAWPAQEGLIGHIMNRDFTPRLWPANGHYDPNGFIATMYYMPRTAMSLAAATLTSGDPKYVEGAYRACRTYVLRSKQVGEGRFLIPVFRSDGTVAEQSVEWVRPSNFAIMVRALLCCHTAFVYLNRPDEAAASLDLAYQVAMGLRAVRGPDGEWSTRYNYNDPRYNGGNGFVNTPHYAFWRLYERLKSSDPDKADKIQALISDHLDTFPGLISDRPMVSSALGGDEDIPNDPQSWAGATIVALVKYLLDGEPRMSARTIACARAGLWNSDFYIDRPETFAFPASEAMLPTFVGGYQGARSYGGMYDLVQEEARVAVAEHLGDQCSADAAAYLFASRLAWAVEPDGYVCGLEQSVPGLYYRNRDYAETLNYGGVGIYALWYWRHILQK